jgi:hypothetical protein
MGSNFGRDELLAMFRRKHDVNQHADERLCHDIFSISRPFMRPFQGRTILFIPPAAVPPAIE